MSGSPFPLVSCIMPTHGRRRFVPQAIRYFLRQTYANRELVIVDDGADAVSDLVPGDERIRYLCLGGRKRSVGAKRNLACEEAKGDLILHWDDDDWMADRRIACQVEELLASGADACGLDRLLFLDPTSMAAWQYVYSGARRPWLAGGTLCYTREAWRRHPFPEVSAGEDTRFVWSRAVRRAVALRDTSLYVALIHAGNTSPKRTRGRQWRAHPLAEVREILAGDWTFYAGGAAPPDAAARRLPSASVARVPEAPPPRLSIVLPVHASGAALLERTLLALAGQTGNPDLFEVVVAADVGDASGAVAAALRSSDRPYRCRLVEAPRPLGDLPHRNHARNVGCRDAAGELLWILDADFILPAHAVEHALAEYDRVRARGAIPVLSPCLAGMREAPARWLSSTRAAMKRLDAHDLLGIARGHRIRRDQYSGFAEQHRPGEPLSERCPALLEGFPVLPKSLWQALDGFDESFVGWGGNKEEFVRRLVALDRNDIVEVRLLRSVLALHQPHAPDPQKAAQSAGRRENQLRFRRIVDGLGSGAPWWREQRERARQAVRGSTPHRRAAPDRRPAPGGAALRLRVGLLTVNDSRKGLWRDAETLAWALAGSPVRAAGGTGVDVSLFPVSSLQRNVEPNPRGATASSIPGGASPEAFAAAVAPRTAFAGWVASLDVLIACEVWLPRTFQFVRHAGVRLVFVPNLEWAHLDGDTERWVAAVRESGVEVWAKTREAHRALSEVGILSHPVPWSIPDPIRREPTPADAQRTRFLLAAGMGGWQGRRGVDIALRAFALARAEDPRLELVLHSIRPLAEYVSDAPTGTPGLGVQEGLLPRDRLMCLHDEADAVLYPARFDGFGLSLLESLHAGLPVLCTDGDPMRELIEHEHNGLLVGSSAAGAVRLASRWECSERALADSMLRLAREPDLLRRLTCPEPGALAARRHAFLLRVRERLCQEAPPRIVLLHSDRTGDGSRLSELYWADALREHGYAVDAHPYSAAPFTRGEALREPPDFVLLGKAPPQLIREVRQVCAAPVVMWHHDLSDATPDRLRWFREVALLCDLVAVPEDGGRLRGPDGSRAVQLFPGAKVEGDRGPGRRPRLRSVDGDGRAVVFLGRATGERAALLRILAERFEVKIYGDPVGWRAHGLTAEGPCWGAPADEVIAGAGVVLSMSARHDRYYTSNRLFHSAAAGGCLLVRAFPGLEALYPDDAVETFRDPGEAVAKVAELLIRPERRRTMKRRAEEHSFRHHTWLDRVGELLEHVRGLGRAAVVSRAAPLTPASAAPVSPSAAPGGHNGKPDLWEERAARLGARSVGHHRWSEEEFQRETERCWAIASTHLSGHRGDGDRRVLDFGCGAGRFSTRLAAEGFEVTGADITAALLELARQASRPFKLVRVARGAHLPFRDGAFDVLWTAFTLQHVPESEFDYLTGELRRVTRPGGLVALIENTFRHTGRTSRSGHVVFRRPREYLAAFPGVKVVDRIDIEGEQHSLLLGRLSR